MKTSLKQSLHNLINSQPFTPYNEIVSLTLRLGHKPSNMERRLRASDSPTIQTVYNDKGFIIGYKPIEEGQLVLL